MSLNLIKHHDVNVYEQAKLGVMIFKENQVDRIKREKRVEERNEYGPP